MPSSDEASRRAILTAAGSGFIAAAAIGAGEARAAKGKPSAVIDPVLADLVAREAIRDLTMRSAHAVDRRAWDLLPALYWPDAMLEMDGHRAPAGEFIAIAKANYERAQVGVTQHLIGNILIAVNGDRAEAEIYHQAIHRVPIDGVQRDVLIGGRYHDSFTRRGTEWRIAGRKVVFDWFRVFADSGDWKDGVFGINAAKAQIAEPAPETWAPITKLLRQGKD